MPGYLYHGSSVTAGEPMECQAGPESDPNGSTSAKIYSIDEYIELLNRMKNKGYTSVVTTVRREGEQLAPTEKNPCFRLNMALDARIFKDAKAGNMGLEKIEYEKDGDPMLYLNIFFHESQKASLNIVATGEDIVIPAWREKKVKKRNDKPKE